MRQLTAAVVLLSASFLLAACGDGGAQPESQPTAGSSPSPGDDSATPASGETPSAEPSEQAGVLSAVGGLALTPESSLPLGDGCTPLISNQELHERVFELDAGDQVRIRDASGTIVATAELEESVGQDKACHWSFNTTVPAGGGFYTAEVESFETPAVSEDEANGLLLFDFTSAF